MSEVFESGADGERGFQVPETGSRWMQTAGRDWQTCGHDGFWIKPLLEDADRGRRSWLMKIDAGAFSASHAHEELEQVYVLEGSFYDEERSYGPGDYVLRAPGAMHTAGSENGAVMLVVYTAA